MSSNNGNISSNNGNRLSDKEIVITSWSLKNPDSHGEARLELNYANNAPEAVFKDKRKVVQAADIRPGGKYRK